MCACVLEYRPECECVGGVNLYENAFVYERVNVYASVRA